MTHSLVRWLVLFAVAARAGRGALGLGKSLPYGDLDRRMSVLAVIVTDLQIVFGLLLFAVSPIVRQGLADPGTAMKTASIRLVLVEHPVTAVAGAVLVHVAHAFGKRSTDDRKRHAIATVCGVLAFVLIISRMRW